MPYPLFHPGGGSSTNTNHEMQRSSMDLHRRVDVFTIIEYLSDASRGVYRIAFCNEIFNSLFLLNPTFTPRRILPQHERKDEERCPDYDLNPFYPAKPGEELANRYQTLVKGWQGYLLYCMVCS